MGCISTKENIHYSTLNCRVIHIQEYQQAFGFKVLDNKKDTLLVISFKNSYYDKNNYKKPKLKLLKEIKIDQSYDFILSTKKPTVSTMEQLGAFIIIENDTICRGKSYKTLLSTFISHNTIGEFYGKTKQ